MSTLKTLSMLQVEQPTTSFQGNWFQPMDLGWDIEIGWKKYTFWIPFSYFLDTLKKKRVLFNITPTALKLLPAISELEEVKWLHTWYDTVLSLAKEYRRLWMKSIIIWNATKFLSDGYLIVSDKKEPDVWLDSIYGENVTFDDILFWRATLVKKNPQIVDVKIISRQDVDKVREALGLSNVATQTLDELKWIVKRLWLIRNVRELTSNQARTYYLRLITDYTSKKTTLWRDLTDKEKDEVISVVNEFIDSIASLVTRF